LESPRVDVGAEPVAPRGSEGVAPSPTGRKARAMSFGRGRRRDPAPGGRALPPQPEPELVPLSSSAPAEERHVRVFAGAAEDPSPPVVDVPGDERDDAESERDREARIDEMERALESFGRRRSPDYGRRGRRR